ncbi:MAG: hypothetical protein Q9222_003503 [Ikaeria aurantiellina]
MAPEIMKAERPAQTPQTTGNDPPKEDVVKDSQTVTFQVKTKETTMDKSSKQASDAGENKGFNPSKVRKRTKTGCLTSMTKPVTAHQAYGTHEPHPGEIPSQGFARSYSDVSSQLHPVASHGGAWHNLETNTEPSNHLPPHFHPASQSHYLPTKDVAPSKHDPAYNRPEYHSHGTLSGELTDSSIQLERNAPKLSPKGSNRYDPTVPALYDPSLEDPEDDYFDVNSDDEEAEPEFVMSDTPKSDLGLMLALAANQNNTEFRSLTNFLNEPNILASYRPPYTASPLMDPQTARVFCHFVTATAPTLSLHNRHPVNPSVMFTGAPVPAFQRSLFTYTLPMMALSNQALLHAQLALASLHIAKLQQTSPAPSLKHYHYALRRVAKAVGHPTKRRDIATLAATLLLGFFEVTTAEHNKWNSHLAGARELLLEIDFAGLTKRINAYKAETYRRRKGSLYEYGHDYYYNEQQRQSLDILRTDKDLDENLIGTLMGWRTRYDEYGRVINTDEAPSDYHIPLTLKDIEDFEIQCDLFWWYAKQDMYQSLISGNRLLLSYDRWSHCPPRAPVGRLDAVYGSMDHLILLFARLTDFGSRDLARKIKSQAKAEKERQRLASQNAPSWSPGQNPQAPENGQQPAQRPPPMYGMMPNPGPVHLPSAFDQSRQDQLNENNKIVVQDAELDTATYAAEQEWTSICVALDLLEQAFGPDFQPLSPDHMTPLSTPFGPALYYRTYSIACLWCLFCTAHIFAARVAPNMPPAAMVAAGVSARQTAPMANTIGRICAGLQPASSTAPLNPSHGAALMDSCMGLFHAGVQFRDAAQRGWTITRLRNIARLTGWQTSALIASGCERAWMAAAEAGKGPPYTRTMNATAKDDRVSGRSRDPNQGPPKDNNDRRFITVNPGTRVYWAMGILGMEEDMKALDIG